MHGPKFLYGAMVVVFVVALYLILTACATANASPPKRVTLAELCGRPYTVFDDENGVEHDCTLGHPYRDGKPIPYGENVELMALCGKPYTVFEDDAGVDHVCPEKR